MTLGIPGRYKANGIYFMKFAGCSVRARGNERCKIRAQHIHYRGPFLEGPGKFSHPEPENHGKISYPVTTGLVCGYIHYMNRGPL